MSQNDAPATSLARPGPTTVSESDYSPPRGNPFPIVGVGASAGGLEAFTQLLGSIPEDTGLAFVFVQHLDPQHESLLTEILAAATKMPVETVLDGNEVKPDHVYVMPPNTSIELQDGSLHLVQRAPGLHLPVDIFFRSLARVQGSRAIGVILSGNASDGSLGVQAIKAECGITFAQDIATARFSGMPRNAVATGAIDYVLSPPDIGKELVRLAKHKFLIPATPGVAESETLPDGDGDLKRILALLRNSTKVDFSQYKQTTIRRRISRRLMILRIETLPDYVRYLQQTPAELDELYQDLLIRVTSFFRDPERFEALVEHLGPALEARAQHQEPVRMWVPGCATGEEVYSLAIRIHEFIAERDLGLEIQIFGTDISEPALERARQGIYGGTITDDVSESRLRRFFTKTDGSYQINKIIRQCCIFARHDVTRDPPFSRLDVLSCRNVFIYLDVPTQRRILPTFHYALNPTGLLMLGTAETTGPAGDLFTVVDPAHHIYSRKSVPTRMLLELTSAGHSPESAHAPARSRVSGELDLQTKLDRVIESKYSPDGMVVNAEQHIMHFKGHIAPYLDPSPGDVSLNLLRMVKESLVAPLRRAIQTAGQSGSFVREEGVPVEIGGELHQVAFEITPIMAGQPPDRYFLIVFEREAALHQERLAESTAADRPNGQETEALEKELAETRDYLRTVREEYEAHAEELRALNEEARSANEELQSTNEELGTTKEELQSANEELTTVNEELQNRNQDLAAINSDLRNVLAAVTFAVVMVDQDLRVRRFNSAAEKLLDLGGIDVGRPIAHLRGRVQTQQLENQIKNVIESLNATTEEVQDEEGRWFSMGVRPYRTLDDRIAGAVITFQNIDVLKRALETSENARQYAEALIETVREPLVTLDADLRVMRATPAFYQTFLVSREETEGRLLYDLGNGQWNRPRLRELLGAALFKSEAFHDFEVEHDFPHIGRRSMRLNARRIPRRDPQQFTILLAIEDVSERREKAEIRYQRVFETAKDGLLVINAETEIVEDANPFFLQLTGFEREDLVGRSIANAGALLHLPDAEGIISQTRASEIVRRDDVPITTRAGAYLSVEVVANCYTVGTQPVVQLNVRDITARKRAAKSLQESEDRLRLVVDSVRDYAIFQLDNAGAIITWNAGAERLLGWKEAEILGKSVEKMFTPEDVERGEPQREIETARDSGRSADERWHMRKDGSRFFASGVLTRASEAGGDACTFTKVMRDITARKEQEDQLRRSLEEKSLLVREIHHRVKNNLLMLVSLLDLQRNHAGDTNVIRAFEEIEGRVRAIARIHEHLYASDDLTEIQIGEYLSALARELISLHPRPDKIQLHLDVEEMALHIDAAVPLGLVVNELITNSFKHGLRDGKLDLRLALKSERHTDGSKWARLSVEDNGPGFPPDLDLSQAQSMGYRLVNLLVRQLRGHREMGSGPGASVTVDFPIARPSESAEPRA